MSPRHHPSADLLADYSFGRLRPGAAVIVRAHLTHCPHCCGEVDTLEAIGGALLDTEEPVDLGPDALAACLAAIDRPPARSAASSALRAEATILPAGMRDLALRKRRWVAPGIWITPVKEAAASRELVYLLRIGKGMVLPRHTHNGAEFTCVLKGSFSDDGGVYAVGDFVETDGRVEHKPVVGPEGECICIASTDAPLVMRDPIGRLFQPFTGI